MIRLDCFDLDGTLTRTDTFRFVAEKLGFLDIVLHFEEELKSGRLKDNKQVAQDTAFKFKGISLDTVNDLLSGILEISNIGPAVSRLKERGIVPVLASIQWSFLVEPFAVKYGFNDYCGTAMKVIGGVLTGEIESYCTSEDKLQFFRRTCDNLGISVHEAVAIGDSRSDHPVFRAAGTSIALNADEETKRMATHSIDTGDMLDILEYFR